MATPAEASPTDWWRISGGALLRALRRCAEGEDPDLVYAEMFANSREVTDG